MGYVERPQHIRVDYVDFQGQAKHISLRGFLATVFQHEFDHLQGHLYVDRLKDPSLFAFESRVSAIPPGRLGRTTRLIRREITGRPDCQFHPTNEIQSLPESC